MYAKKSKKPLRRKIVLRLPDLDHAKSAVLCSLSSPNSGEITIRRGKGVKQLGVRVGDWLTLEQSLALLEKSDGNSLRNSRDLAMISIPLGCGLPSGPLIDGAIVSSPPRFARGQMCANIIGVGFCAEAGLVGDEDAAVFHQRAVMGDEV